MRNFIIKMAAVVMFLACILILDGLVMGYLPLLGGILLLLGGAFFTFRLLRRALRPARRTARRRAHSTVAPRPRPALRVVAPHHPGGPHKAA